MRCHPPLWLIVLLAAPALAQPITPGVPLPYVNHMTTESAAMRESRFLFEEGRRLHRSRQFERASDLYSKALLRDPARLEYRPDLAAALEAQGRWQEALEQYDLYLAQEPNTPAVRRGRLLCLIELGRWNEVDQALAQSDATLDTQYLQGLAWLRRGEAARAVAPLRAAVVAEPQRAEVRLNLASALLTTGQAQEALDALNDSSVRDLPAAGLRRGFALYALGRRSDAEFCWRGLLSGSEAVPAGVALATSLAERGADREALLTAAAALDRDGDDPSARLLYARLLNRAERYEEAWKLLVDRVGPQASGYELELAGWAQLGLHHPAEARTLLSRASAAGVSGAALEHNLGLALAAAGDRAGAVQHLSRATKLEPRRSEAWYSLGYLLERSGRSADAARAYRTFLLLAPDDPRADDVRLRLSRR